jgi:hypothetical protein
MKCISSGSTNDEGVDRLAVPDRAIFVVVSAIILSTFTTQVIATPKRGVSDTAAPTEVIINECKQQYSALKNEVEEKAEPIRKARQQTVTPDELCRAITSYEEAELKIIGFVAANSKKCGFPPRVSQELISVYEGMGTLKEKTCPKKPLRFG